MLTQDFPHSSLVKSLPAMQKTWVWSLGQEDCLEKKMATHSSILAWEIPGMEEPGRLQSMGLQRVRHDWVTTTINKPWTREDAIHSLPASPKHYWQHLTALAALLSNPSEVLGNQHNQKQHLPMPQGRKCWRTHSRFLCPSGGVTLCFILSSRVPQELSRSFPRMSPA